MTKILLETDNLKKSFDHSSGSITLFKDIVIKIKEGDLVALVGPSGSGKSSLLHLLALLDEPSKGKITIDSQETKSLSNNQKDDLRRRLISTGAKESIKKGKVIAWFQGKLEFGDRALGNRSIVANPSNIIVKDKINETIKNRDFWMPFAASVIKSKYKNYFGKNLIVNNYNYMTNCTNTLGKSNHLLSASIHPYDKTCRPQIISKNQNTNYEDLISKFGKIQ